MRLESQKTSVITPVRNGEAFIEQAIASVLSQIGPNDEHIVIDDGSTDRTWEIVSQIRDARVRLIKSARPGVSAARNTGLAHASGEFIAFLDADDEWTPGRHEAMLSYLAARPDLDAVYGYFSTKFEEDAPFRDSFEKFAQAQIPSAFFGSGLYRRSIFVRAGNFAEDMSHAEDVDFYNRLEEAGLRMERLPIEVCIYRRHKSNVTNDLAAARRGFMEMLRRKLMRARMNSERASVDKA